MNKLLYQPCGAASISAKELMRSAGRFANLQRRAAYLEVEFTRGIYLYKETAEWF